MPGSKISAGREHYKLSAFSTLPVQKTDRLLPPNGDLRATTFRAAAAVEWRSSSLAYTPADERTCRMKIVASLLLSAAVIVLSSGVSFAQAAGEGMKAVCVLEPIGKSGVTGTVVFEMVNNHVHVSGKISGLAPGKHGFHVHQFGDLSDSEKGESAGGHFNPHKMIHGAPDARTRHVGDLGNVEANAEGVAVIDQDDRLIKLSGGDSIIGRSVVVHAKPDNFGQPTGNAGGRVAVGIIGWANPKTK
jgi:Cu-Zn family superoxide dismutase